MRAYYQVVRTASRSLRRNAMRSALTSLGIVIGISAVVAMVEIGRGGAEAIDRSIASLGASVIQVDPSDTAVGGVSTGAGSRVTLTPEDCDAIRRECDA